MFKKIILAAMFLTLSLTILAVSACSAKPASAADAKKVTAKQTTIEAKQAGDTVSIPLADVEKVTNARFKVTTLNGVLSFMAYKYNNQLYVRADICPPCRSQSFTLTKGTLVCDTCGTVFNAANGAGISGACVKFAKQSVSYIVVDGNIVMQQAALNTAYANTLNPTY
jgi:nitrite reductase/ring-hydroxylating ferredoxin subunit